MVETSLTYSVGTTFSQDEIAISDLDHCMDHVSFGLAQYLHVEKLIESVKVRFEYIFNISSAHKNRRHHKIKHCMLTMKWGVSD